MKNFFKIFLILLSGVMVLDSCMVVEKRHYRKGFYVDRMGCCERNNMIGEKIMADENPDYSSNYNEVLVNGGSEFLDVTSTDPQNLWLCSTDKNYAELQIQGSKLQNHQPKQNEQEIEQGENNKFCFKNKNRSLAKANVEPIGRIWFIALLLCLVFGFVGLHRLYLGYPVIAIIQMLTCGGFLIWWIIDFIRITSRDLKPKDDEYIF